MKTENLQTLKIHKLSKEQYNRELEAGRIVPNEFYLVEDEEIDFASLNLITVDDIDAICGTQIQVANEENEVTF